MKFFGLGTILVLIGVIVASGQRPGGNPRIFPPLDGPKIFVSLRPVLIATITLCERLYSILQRANETAICSDLQRLLPLSRGGFDAVDLVGMQTGMTPQSRAIRGL